VSEQLTLDLEAPRLDVSPYWAAKATEFHEKNPHVYYELTKYARQAVAAGHSRVGIELLWNRMRWDWMLRTDHGTDYKLNQNYKAWYARRIMELEPDLSEIFETRSRR